MKRLLLPILLLTISYSCKEKTTIPEEVITTHTETVTPKLPKATFLTETLELTHCESAVYDSQHNRIYASLIGNNEKGDGSVVTISTDGKLINSQYITGLNDPKGIAITEDKLYVSDVTELVEANRSTGEIIKKYTLETIQFLNDVAIAPDGSVYVSDTRTSEVYKLDSEGNFTRWLADAALDNPNGLLIQGDTMYVASWGGSPDGGRVSKIDMNTQVITPISEVIGNLDGIRPYDKDHLIISDWRSGKTHLINFEGATQEVVQVGQSVGDIAYIKEKNLLLLPMNKQSRLLFYTLE